MNEQFIQEAQMFASKEVARLLSAQEMIDMTDKQIATLMKEPMCVYMILFGEKMPITNTEADVLVRQKDLLNAQDAWIAEKYFE